MFTYQTPTRHALLATQKRAFCQILVFTDSSTYFRSCSLLKSTYVRCAVNIPNIFTTAKTLELLLLLLPHLLFLLRNLNFNLRVETYAVSK